MALYSAIIEGKSKYVTKNNRSGKQNEPKEFAQHALNRGGANKTYSSTLSMSSLTGSSYLLLFLVVMNFIITCSPTSHVCAIRLQVHKVADKSGNTHKRSPAVAVPVRDDVLPDTMPPRMMELRSMAAYPSLSLQDSQYNQDKQSMLNDNGDDYDSFNYLVDNNNDEEQPFLEREIGPSLVPLFWTDVLQNEINYEKKQQQQLSRRSNSPEEVVLKKILSSYARQQQQQQPMGEEDYPISYLRKPVY